MDLKVSHNSFIKLKDFFKLLDLSVEVDEYNIKNDLLDGVLVLKGKYIKRDNITEEYFSEKIPFTVAFPDQFFEVEDINCLDLEYIAIDGRGLDVSFDIFIKYETDEDDSIMVPVIEDIEKCENLDVLEVEDITNNEFEELNQEDSSRVEINDSINDEYEELKMIETKRIDNLLKSKLEVKDDNLPTEEVIIRGLKEEKSKISVCYYKNDSELEAVCNKKGLSIDNIYKSNQQYHINQYRRVIINDK